MQSRLYAALRSEIDSSRSCARGPTRGYGETWESHNTLVGLFVASNGARIIETHGIKASVRAKTAPDAHPAGTFVSL